MSELDKYFEPRKKPAMPPAIAALKSDRLVVCEHCEKTIAENAALKRENEVLRKKSESADRLIDETSKALLTAIDALLEKQA